MEHVNLNVPTWTKELDTFWFRTLGFAQDTRAAGIAKAVNDAGGSMGGLMWANAGLQQIHMPLGEPAPEDVQAPAGVIGLVYEDLPRLRAELEAGGIPYEEVYASGDHYSVPRIGARALEFRSPTGVRLRAHGLAADVSGAAASSWFGPYGPLLPAEAAAGGVGLPSERPSKCLGIPYVRLLCAFGASVGLRRFYQQVFGVEAQLRGAPGSLECWVPIGAEQWLVYEEAAENATVPYDGYHVAIYVNGFVDAYQRASELGLVWNNPRFPHLVYDTLEQAINHSEFRVRELVDPESGAVVHTLEHEVRALSHPGFSCRSWLPGASDGRPTTPRDDL